MIVEFTVRQTGQNALVNVRESSFSLMVDTATIYNFDRAGRLIGAYKGGRNYLRGLDNRVLVKWGAGHGLARRHRRHLSEEEKQSFFADMQELAASVEVAIREGRVDASTGVIPSAGLQLAADALASVRSYGYRELQADAERFRAIYKPVSILPPDQYLAVVIQATEGCSYNKCTFCTFYRDRRFRIKGDAELRDHVRAVMSFFGPALSLRRSVFLADANALVVPQNRLLSLLDLLNAELPIIPARSEGNLADWKARHPYVLHGIYSFVDAFTGHRKSAADYRALAERNVRRVYIGLESGDDALLAFLRKGTTTATILTAVEAIKGGGLDVGVILMLGVGGRRFAADHVRCSIAVLNAMHLGERDMIYFSPLVADTGSEYARLAAKQRVQPLSAAEMDEQMTAIRSGLRFADGARLPKIAVYDMREFIY